MKTVSILCASIFILFYSSGLIAQVDAGADKTVCESEAAVTIGAITPGGIWSTTSNALILTINDPSTMVTNLDYGPNVFTWTIGNDSDNVVITDNEIVADAGADQSLCDTYTCTLNGNNPSPGTGTWTYLNAGTVISNPSSPNTSATGLLLGYNEFRWIIVNNSCPSSDTLAVYVYEQVIANAFSDQDLQCDFDITSLSAMTSPGSGVWSVVSGAGTFTDVSINSTSVNNIGPGENIFRWSVTNGPCTASDDVIVNTFFNTTIANAGTDDLICNPASYQLNADFPATGGGTWSIVSGSAVFSNISLHNTSINSVAAGLNVFAWTVNNGDCGNISDNVLITNNIVPVANAGSDDALCDVSSYNLSASPASGFTTAWTILSGSGAFADNTLNNTSVANLTEGDNTFRWTVSSGICNSYDDVTIHRDVTIVAYAGLDDTTCLPDYILSGNDPFPGTGAWYSSNAGIGYSDPGNPFCKVSNLPSGPTTLSWNITNGTCTSGDDVDITYSSPFAYAGTDANLCDASDYNLSASDVAGATGSWNIVSGSGVFANSSLYNTSVTNLSEGDNVFSWTVSADGCSSSDEVIVRRDVTVAANAGLDDGTCSPDYTLSGNDPFPGMGAWSSATTGIGYSDPGNPFCQLSGLPIGATTLSWNITNGICTSSDDVVITRTTILSGSIINGPMTVCANQNGTFYSVNYQEGFSYLWQVDGGTIVNGQNTHQITVDWGYTTNNNSVQVIETDAGNCSAENDVPINIETDVASRIISKSDNLLICVDSGMVNYQWYVNGSAITNGNRQFYWSENLDGDYSVEMVSHNNCVRHSPSENIVSKKLKLFPNPVSTSLNISINNKQTGEVLILFKDLSGKIVKLATYEKKSDILQMTLPINGIRQGIYSVDIFIDGQLYQARKLIVQ